MVKEVFHKTSIVLALCGLIMLTMLASGGSASAQSTRADNHLKSLPVVNSSIAAPHQSVVVRAFCPAGDVALSGKVKVYHAAKVNIFALARNAFVVQYSRPTVGHRGWVASVLNRTRLPLRVQVTAACVPLPNL